MLFAITVGRKWRRHGDRKAVVFLTTDERVWYTSSVMSIGFLKPRTLDPIRAELSHYKTYGDTVQYDGETPHGKTSVYIPKKWFKSSPPYPTKVIMQMVVSDAAEWTKE
jgi:hypothetical protein